MNPYQYAEYRNPWAPSIAQVLLHSGDIEAQRAATVAGAQARATEIGGQATAAAVGSIGAHLAGVVDAASNPQRQLAGAQLDAVKRDNRSRLILETELKNPANLKPDGSIDDQAITARLKAQDVGAWQSWSAISSANQKNALDLRAKGAEIAKTTVDTAEKTRQFQQAQADYLGRLAYNGLDALQAKPGDPLHARDTVLAMTARAIVDGGISEGEGKDFLMQTAHATPDQLTALFASVVPPELKAKLEKEHADTAKSNAEAARAAAEAKNIGTYGSPTPPSSTSKPMRVKGVGDVPVEYVPGKTGQGGSYFLQNPDGTRRQLTPGVDFTEIPPASIQIHTADAQALGAGGEVDASRPDPATANKIDPKLGITPNAVYQGAISFALEGKLPAMGRMSGPIGKAQQSAVQNKAAAIAAAAGVDIPTVRAEYRANAGTLAKLLPQAQATANFANTATDNLDLALGQSAEIARSGSKLANRYLQWAQGELTPAAGLTKFETYVYTAAREYAKVTSGGALSAAALTDAAQKEAAKLLSTTQSPEAFQAAAEAMKADMANVISNQTKGLARVSSTIANFFAAANGVSPAAASTPAPAVPPPGGPAAGGVTVTSPGGKSYTLPTQADADAFVAKAKAQGLWK